jgi:hypothetical protein
LYRIVRQIFFVFDLSAAMIAIEHNAGRHGRVAARDHRGMDEAYFAQGRAFFTR